MINLDNYNLKKVILIGIYNKNISKYELLDNLNELELLVNTLNAKVYKKFSQKLYMPHPKSFIGLGKIEEIKCFIYKNNIDAIVFDEELNAVQLKNLEKYFPKIIIIDRTLLIIDIFAKKARTSYARTQVELAKYQYILPRLKNMWTHLERQKGGIGIKSGAGETEIETDRRIVRNRIFILKKKILNIDKQKKIQRSNRHKISLLHVCLIGYTNVGKSTIMNLLSKANTMCNNSLFVTLDTITRRVVINNIHFLLSDTVGFIRKIPIQLIESFKSTLYEVINANILIHVVDISNNNFQNQIKNVEKTLLDIGVNNNNKIIIFNKIDLLKEKNKKLYNDIKILFMNKYKSVIFLSCINQKNIEYLKYKLYFLLKKNQINNY